MACRLRSWTLELQRTDFKSWLCHLEPVCTNQDLLGASDRKPNWNWLRMGRKRIAIFLSPLSSEFMLFVNFRVFKYYFLSLKRSPFSQSSPYLFKSQLSYHLLHKAVVTAEVSHPYSPLTTGKCVANSSHLRVSLQKMPLVKKNCPSQSHSTYLGTSHIPWLSHVAVSRKYKTWGHPSFRACCWMSGGLRCSCITFSFSPAGSHFLHSPTSVDLKATPWGTSCMKISISEPMSWRIWFKTDATLDTS